jgi:putative CocE/NonD family hydrolase
MPTVDYGLDDLLRSEYREGMRVDWDVPIHMDDGLTLRCNVYRPDDEGKYPVIMTLGPYGKDLSWQEGYKTTWDLLSDEHPEVLEGSTNLHQSWEVIDPEKWVPDGYVVIRIDSRGAGRSPGIIDTRCPREIEDFKQCIEWAGIQPWSNGKVGLNGISYYAIIQWFVAALKPKHLVAMCVWEGAGDYYRDSTHHGGILSTFQTNWYDMQVSSVQHGLGNRGKKSAVHGESVCGPENLSDTKLKANRLDLGREIKEHILDGPWYRERSADFPKVETPFISCANWGGQGLHPRGNFNGFMQATSEQKWLECHGLEHWTEFYTPYGADLQKRFFGHFLKGDDTGWNNQPKVQLQIRRPGEYFEVRGENEWPLARTRWTKAYLEPETMTLGKTRPLARLKHIYDSMGDGATFFLPAWSDEREITGPMAAKLFISSETADADLFLVVRLFSADMREVTFKGTLDPNTPLAQGWLRASHRKLDLEKSKPWQPWHPHDEIQPLVPDEITELDIEIWPTCIVVPPSYRVALTIRGKDYENPWETTHKLSNMKNVFRGCGPFLHDDPEDRPPKIFDGKVTIHSGPDHPSHLLLPFVPLTE